MPAAARLSATPAVDSLAVARSLEQIRAQMDEVVIGKRPAGLPMPTGVPLLDAALGGGVPRGRITEVVGMRGVGKTALLREVVRRVLAAGSWVAWVDARRTLAAAPWASLGSRLVMIRPRDAARGAWCADTLLRSGVFALVVLDGAPPLSRVNGVRLAQLARERDAALVIVADGTQPSRVGGAVRLKVTPQAATTARRRSPSTAEAAPGPAPGFLVTVEKGGVFRSVEVSSAVVVARRVCTDPEIPDRRGVARGTRHTWTPHSHANDATNSAQPITWGGLGASVENVRSADAVLATGHAAGAAVPDADASERRRRDWSSSKGRRRAAESGYGRRSRREAARDRIGAALATQSGQSHGSNGTPRLGRDGGSRTLGGGAAHGVPAAGTHAGAALGRVPAGVG